MRTEPSQYELQQRPTNGVLIAKMLRLAAQGIPPKRAAECLGISYQTALKHYSQPEFRRQLLLMVESAFNEVDNKFADMQLSLHDRIRMKAEDAFEALCEMLDDKAMHPAIRVKIAQDFLDRNPDTMAGSVQLKGIIADPEQLRHAASVAREMDNVIPIKKVG